MESREHPCFSENARHTTGRIHLPVAPKCNIQCNFCNRKFDCVNESRPGVTSTILSPVQAADYLSKVIERIPAIAVAGIAGPGDPLANADETLETFNLIRERFPELHLCMATNGLELATYGSDIADAGINHVTVTVNAVDPEIGSHVYSWVRYNRRPYRGIDGASLLLERQRAGIKALKKYGVTVKINTVVIPGINDHHVADVAREMSLLGADVQNCIPLYHVQGTAFEGLPPLKGDVMNDIRNESSKYIRQMTHCQRCRADAAGMLGEANSMEINDLLASAASSGKDRPYIAVASMEGLFVNQHLGESSALWIFRDDNGRPELIERRPAPVRGGGDSRWTQMAHVLADCRAVLVSGVGQAPKSFLERSGIRVVAMEGLAEEGLTAVFSNRSVPEILIRSAGGCGMGSSCGGTGTGCG